MTTPINLKQQEYVLMPIALQIILRFFVLIFVQLLVMNNIQFLGFVSPFIYILFIITLPVRMDKWAVLLLAFVIGLVIDIFSNTGGMHAFSTVLVAFLRQDIIKLYLNIEEGANPVPSFHTFGVGAYVKYAVSIVLVHHFVLFFVESFSFFQFWLMMGKVVVNSLITVLIVLGIQLFYRK